MGVDGGWGAYLVFSGRGLGDGDLLEWVVHFSWLALDLLDRDGRRHGVRQMSKLCAGMCLLEYHD